MPYIRTSCTVDPAQWFRVGEQVSQKYRETLADAQATMSRALQTRSPVDAWATQFAFGARNVRRWSEWAWDGQQKPPTNAAEMKAPAPEPASAPSVESLPLRLVHEAAETAKASALPVADVSDTVVEVPAVEEAAAEEAAAEEAAPMPVTEAEIVEPTAPEQPLEQPLPSAQAQLAIEPLPAAEIVGDASDATESADAPSDDLQKIRGIGRTIEQKLNRLGIFRFAQIAAMDDDEIARIDAELEFRGRIERDDWVAQAQRLQRESAPH